MIQRTAEGGATQVRHRHGLLQAQLVHQFVQPELALVAPGTFGVASDVRNIKDAYNPGTGLQVLQRLDMPYMGKIYMSTTLRWGTVLADKDFIVYARNLTPNT